MAKKITGWKTKGMNRDLSVSAFNPEFSFENMNLRLSTNEGNTLLSWVNERGTKEVDYNVRNPEIEVVEGETREYQDIYGKVIGTAVLNHQLVLFTTRTYDSSGILVHEDRIYKCWITQKSGSYFRMDVLRLFKGNLNLSEDHPIETLTSYEAEHIQKVYWTDGKNQPRVINIYVGNISQFNAMSNPNMFDFVPTLLLNETVKVKKVFGANGMFPPGVIQYALTYYNKYGQESNIFYTTHLCYISHLDRGASPDDTRVDNAFEITVTNLDTNFDYLRIYSIQRTSINGTPICKRVHDISIKDLPVDSNNKKNAVYLDTGYEGETIDPTELLYKGGEAITAKTMENKDDTLFFGNVTMLRQPINDTLRGRIKICATNGIVNYRRTVAPMQSTAFPYIYGNQLSTLTDGESQPCAGFNPMQQYMLGVQFQHKTGKWSDPVFLKNSYSNQPDVPYFPTYSGSSVNVPYFKLTVDFSSVQEALTNLGYIKVRPVYVYPEQKDRNIVCEGVLNPTVYVQNKRNHNELYGQSSWFFRPNSKHTIDGTEYNCYEIDNSLIAPISRGMLSYTHTTGRGGGYNPFGPITKIRATEIQGYYTSGNSFKLDSDLVTFHSPEIEFDTEYSVMDYSNLDATSVGVAQIAATMSDIDIQTETPTISNSASGFVHKSFSNTNSAASFGIVAGLFYDDYIVDDSNDNTEDNKLLGWDKQLASVKWMVYPWQKDGSLNNDINRPANKGIASAILKKKVISNLRYTNTNYYTDRQLIVDYTQPSIKLFDSDDNTYLKISNGLYQGNVDTLLSPNMSEGLYFAWEGVSIKSTDTTFQYYTFNPTTQATPFNSTEWWRTNLLYDTNNNEAWYGLQKYYSTIDGTWYKAIVDGTSLSDQDIGDGYRDLLTKKGAVRMKYKSTKHLVVQFPSNSPATKPKELGDGTDPSLITQGALQVVQLRRKDSTPYSDVDDSTRKNYTWIPCGKKTSITSNTVLDYIWGDTYFQRYDCLKTYPFTNEDPNQIVEVGSFMLETRVNIDGRYDRNRGQLNNGTISPRNFNLINPVYSQVDNFFNYKIQDTDKKETHIYPNYVYYSQSKTAGSDVDMWTHVTLASVLEMDGDKGQVNSLQRFNNQLIAFQDTGISQILYNENTQITTTDGVPIEIANSGKVQGKRYLSNTVGCSNKWSIVQTPSGIYFIDSHDKSIYFFNGQLQNLSTAQGFNTWAKKNIKLPLSDGNTYTPTWTPDVFGDFVSYYDKQNQDVLFINANTALAYSEKVGTFTSFYDYGHIPYFCNLDDCGIWLKHNGGNVPGDIVSELYVHQKGNYCEFFGTRKPYWMTLVGNPEPQMDKIFTNLEFRACVDTDGTLANDKFTPLLPFDYLETWNEHQHGKATLQNKNGHGAQQHHLRDTNLTAALKRKFRIWRCDIPRDNVPIPTIPSGDGVTQEEIDGAMEIQEDFFYHEAEKGIYRKEAHPIDRMRNPWLYLKLMKNAAGNNQHLQRTEIHDILMSYFS